MASVLFVNQSRTGLSALPTANYEALFQFTTAQIVIHFMQFRWLIY